MHNLCGKCAGLMTFLILAIGVLFLLQDYEVITFFKISWYTVIFLLVAIGHIGYAVCPACQLQNKKKK
ncbi:hypothetical protein ACFL1H_08110 [Nanoarchaeota archaeon]